MMTTRIWAPRGSRLLAYLPLFLLPISLAGCANAVVYTHTTTVKASAQELNIEAPGIVPDVHVKDGVVEVKITTEIAISNTKVFVSNEVRRAP